MTKTVWVFPGQGSQAIGMGSDLYDLSDAQAKFQQAEQILGWSVPEVCQSEDDKVSKTLYTQPCLYVIESILADLMRQQGQQPDLVAGHSLGEYVALYSVGVFDFESGLRLVKRRAELMDASSQGTMAALLGFDRDQLEQQLAQTPDVVLANDNNAGQVVISGTTEAVESILSSVKAKRAVKLNVSGAFHSPLMADAATEFQKDLDAITFRAAQVPVISNAEPTAVTEGIVLKQRVSQQMTSPVRWRETSLKFLDEGIDRVIEIGPGKVLTGIIKRTCPNLALQNVGSLAEIGAGG